MSDHTPTTEQVREVFTLAMVPSSGDQTVPEGEFDRWLAAHDREVQARALEAEANDIQAYTCAGNFNPDMCETCRVVEGLRHTDAHLRGTDALTTEETP